MPNGFSLKASVASLSSSLASLSWHPWLLSQGILGFSLMASLALSPALSRRYHLDSLEMEERYPDETGPLWVKWKRLLFYPRTVEVGKGKREGEEGG